MPKKKQVKLVHPYDGINFDPPAPVVEVSLSVPGILPQGQQIILKLPALLDSGADITVIPEWVAQQLQLRYVDEITASGYDGIPKKTFVYSVKVIFDSLGYFITKAIISDSGYILIGRDILNKWSLFLKGKRKVFEVY